MQHFFEVYKDLEPGKSVEGRHLGGPRRRREGGARVHRAHKESGHSIATGPSLLPPEGDTQAGVMVTSGKHNMPIVTAWVLRGRAALKTCCPLCPANKSCCGFPTPTERYNCRARGA